MGIKKTVNQKELDKFSKLAEEWWDESGKFKILHKINPIRIRYIKEKVLSHFYIKGNEEKPLQGLKVLDIGCGGGLLSVPIHNLGATVTGIDPVKKNINIANSYIKSNNLDIKFLNTTVEDFASNKKLRFDIVLNMEVVEHVDNLPLFLEISAKLMKKNSLMFIATINKTIKSFFEAIIMGEYILKWVPKKTHDWKKFVKPYDIVKTLESHNVKLLDMCGMNYSLLSNSWKLEEKNDVNYLMCLYKK